MAKNSNNQGSANAQSKSGSQKATDKARACSNSSNSSNSSNGNCSSKSSNASDAE